jgi:hypothetical protein
VKRKGGGKKEKRKRKKKTEKHFRKITRINIERRKREKKKRRVAGDRWTVACRAVDKF